MAEKLIQLGVEVAIDQKDIRDLNTLEKRLKALMDTYKMYIDMVSSGQVPMNSKMIFGDNEYTRKQMEREIQNTKRVLDEANKVMGSDKSFGEYFKKYNENLSIQRNNMELYKKLENKNTEEAKRLLKDARNAQDRNRRIRSNMVGVYDFKAYEKEWNKSRDHRDNYNAGKSQLSAEKQAAKDAASTWSTLYKEREAVTKGLGKLSDASKKYATDAKDRLEAINSEMSAIANKWSGNKVFDNTKTSVENKAASANIISGLNEQYKDEHKSLASRMSDVKARLGNLSLSHSKKEISDSKYRDSIRELTHEYHILKKAMKDVDRFTGMGGIEKFNANIKSHLHWIISGALVDKLYEIPNAIKDISVEFDNLERKIAQNIELSGNFEDNHEKLREASRNLVYASFDIANAHGMKMRDVLEMMQIMSRRFKDPNELKYFTNLAAIMSKLDFVEPAVAAESLESIVISFGLSARETTDFVNQFSVATHTMRINGQDLLEAFQRSAPVLKQFGMSTAESVALVSTLSTALGREGKYIGNAITGIFVRLLNNKNQALFERIGISMSKANGEIKTGGELLREYLGHYRELSEEARAKEVADIFGAYRVVPGTAWLKNFQEYVDTLTMIETKSSDALTKKLEKEQLDSHESKINTFNNTVQFLGFLIGDALAPAVTKCLEVIQEFITRLILLDKTYNGTIEAVLLFISVLTSWGMAIKASNALQARYIELVKIAKIAMIKLSAATTANTRITKTALVVQRLFGDSFTNLASRVSIVTGRLLKAGVALAMIVGLIQLVSSVIDANHEHAAIEKTVMDKWGGWENIDPKDPIGARFIAYRDAHENSEARAIKTRIAENPEAYNILYGQDETDTEQDNEEFNNLRRDTYEFAMGVRGVSLYGDSIDLNKKDIEEPAGTEDRVEDGNPSNAGSFVENKADEHLKTILNSKISKLKTDAELKEKGYDSSLKDISFQEELFGKSPSTYMKTSWLRRNYYKILREDNDLIAQEITDIEKKMNDLRAKSKDEEIKDDDGNITTVERQLAVYSESIDELRKYYAEQQEKAKELYREIRKAYTVSPEKEIEEQKERLKTTEELALNRATNKRNAFNNTVKVDIQLEYAKANKKVLEKELSIAMKDVEEWEDQIKRIRNGKSNMDIKEAERELQLARDVQSKKVLAVEQANKKIADLEYEHTEKIREGLHGVVNDLLIQGKSLKDIWNDLWTELAEEALRALMGIQDGQQSTLGAIAAKAFGLDKATPEQKGIEAQTTATTTNTTSLDANTRAIQGLTTSFADSADEISKAALGVSNTIKDTSSKYTYADSMDSISKDSMSAGASSFASQGSGKSADSTMAALGILAAVTSMSGSKKASKLGALLSIAIPFIGGGKAGGAGSSAAAGKGKKKAIASASTAVQWAELSHDGSIVGVTPLPTRYYHNGGNVGTSVVPYLKSDEVNAVLQTGEEVVSRKDRRSNELMSEQNKHMADAMQRMAEGSNTNVTFAIQAIDSKSIVQLLNENGDAIMNILRKQSAYGNGRI